MATLTSPHVLSRPGSVKEQAGIVVELDTYIFVTGITGATVTARYQDVGSALDSGGYTVFSTTSEYTNLRLMEREVSFLDGEPDKAWAHLTYRALGFGGYNNSGSLTARGSGSLQQVPTNFDIYGNQIIVSHTYAADDPGSFAGQTKYVTAEVQQLFPQIELVYEGILQLAAPILFQQSYQGYVNSAWWNGGAPGTWLCTNVEWDQHNTALSPPSYRVTMSFQYDSSTWNPIAIYKDPETNKPPIDVVEGVGVINVYTQPETDFWRIIPG